MMKYNIAISAKHNRKRSLKKLAKSFHLTYHGWTGNKFMCSGEVGEIDYHRLEHICRKKNLILKLKNQFAIRSTNYRQEFFDKNPPAWKNKYFCAYCGALTPVSLITVDHLYPVNCVQTSMKMQKRLQKKGWESINDTRNLVAACDICNKKKSSHMGIWIIKGTLGRYHWLWVIRHTVRMIVAMVVIGAFLWVNLTG